MFTIDTESEKVKKIISITFVISFIAVLMNLVWDYVLPEGQASPIIYNVIMGLIMSTFALLHSLRYFGTLKTLVLFITTASVSLLFEHLGVETGAIYGKYYYGDIYGPKLFGTVPFLIPFSWFLFLYPSIIISNELLSPLKDLKEFQNRGGGIFTIFTFAALDSIIMTALDLLIDPIWTTRGSWFWTGLKDLSPEQIFYKIPVQNYFGWLLTTFLIFLIFRGVFFLTKESFAAKDKMYFLPIYNYIGVFIVGTIELYTLLHNPALIFIALMTLGFITLLILYKIHNFYNGE